MPSDSEEHEVVKARSTSLLYKAREIAVEKRKYNSLDTRTKLETLFSEWSGYNPYEWQVDVAEALLLGLDCVVIAGTGSGKTIPFMLPLLLHPDKMALIISPLKVLQRDQAQRFQKMKIAAAAVNGDTWSPSLFKVTTHKLILGGLHQRRKIEGNPLLPIKLVRALRIIGLEMHSGSPQLTASRNWV